jgi:hypothetical protein
LVASRSVAAASKAALAEMERRGKQKGDVVEAVETEHKEKKCQVEETEAVGGARKEPKEIESSSRMREGRFQSWRGCLPGKVQGGNYQHGATS